MGWEFGFSRQGTATDRLIDALRDPHASQWKINHAMERFVRKFDEKEKAQNTGKYDRILQMITDANKAPPPEKKTWWSKASISKTDSWLTAHVVQKCLSENGSDSKENYEKKTCFSKKSGEFSKEVFNSLSESQKTEIQKYSQTPSKKETGIKDEDLGSIGRRKIEVVKTIASTVHQNKAETFIEKCVKQLEDPASTPKEINEAVRTLNKEVITDVCMQARIVVALANIRKKSHPSQREASNLHGVDIKAFSKWGRWVQPFRKLPYELISMKAEKELMKKCFTVDACAIIQKTHEGIGSVAHTSYSEKQISTEETERLLQSKDSNILNQHPYTFLFLDWHKAKRLLGEVSNELKKKIEEVNTNTLTALPTVLPADITKFPEMKDLKEYSFISKQGVEEVNPSSSLDKQWERKFAVQFIEDEFIEDEPLPQTVLFDVTRYKSCRLGEAQYTRTASAEETTSSPVSSPVQSFCSALIKEAKKHGIQPAVMFVLFEQEVGWGSVCGWIGTINQREDVSKVRAVNLEIEGSFKAGYLEINYKCTIENIDYDTTDQGTQLRNPSLQGFVTATRHVKIAIADLQKVKYKIDSEGKMSFTQEKVDKEEKTYNTKVGFSIEATDSFSAYRSR